jgi:1,2-diacylglycerol 3-alpha-glucosyltransferase
MKIVMICEFYDSSLEYQENLLSRYYSKSGHEVTVLTSTFTDVLDFIADRHDSARPGSETLDATARVIRLPYKYNLLNRFRAYRGVLPLLDRLQPDLIYVHDISPNFPEVIDYHKRHPNSRIIMDYHADYSNSGKNWLSLAILHGVLRKRILDQARPYIQKIFPVVPAAERFLHDVYKVPLQEMEVLPLGGDIDLVVNLRERSPREKIRGLLGIPDDHIVIFTGGKLTPAKRTTLLLDALQQIQSQQSAPKIHLLIAGIVDDANQDYAANLSKKMLGHPNVHMLGWLGREEVYLHMLASDMAVFPAGQSVLWQQSIVCGLPLIAGNSGDQDISYLNCHDNILVLPPERITAVGLAQSMQKLILDSARRLQMAEGATRTATERLDWNVLIDRTLRFN